jgi:hypothetical protein
MQRFVLFAVGLVLVLGSCASPPDDQPAVDRPAVDQPAVEKPQPAPVEEPSEGLRDLALAVADGYKRWLRLDNRMRWAPSLCKAPAPSEARFSASADVDTHGEKLYTLYALDPVAYGHPEATKVQVPPLPAGLPRVEQVLVKQAWRASEVPGWAERTFGSTWGKSRLAPVERDGVFYGGDTLQGLYLILRLAPDEPRGGTDEGWVYATVAPSASEAEPWILTGVGAMKSCMECHHDVDGAGGRLFGLGD